MSDIHFWFGFLDAGERSSPVLMDNRLNTANPATVYVFNLQRNQILEYRRSIVDGKLRELTASEQDLIGDLKSAYRKARSGFVARGGKFSSIPEKSAPPAPPKAAEKIDYEEEEVDYETDDDFIDADDDE